MNKITRPVSWADLERQTGKYIPRAMSHKVPPQSAPTAFSSPSASSYKRRSLQSPFILNDLAGDPEQERSQAKKGIDEEDKSEQEKESEEIEDGMNVFGIGNHPMRDEDLVIHRVGYSDGGGFVKSPTPTPTSEQSFSSDFTQPLRNDSPSLSTQRYSMQSLSSLTGTLNPSLTTSTRKHNRSRSTASTNYIPTNMPPSKPFTRQDTPPLTDSNGAFTGLTNSPLRSPVHQPFRFNSMIMNNSSENLSQPAPPSPQILPKPSYRRGHRYKHSSVSMNMFQDPQRKASINKPHNLPKKYAIPTFKEVTSTITSSQKFKLLVCLLQGLFVLLAYIAGFHYSNGCLSTLAHILFYDVISNFSSITVQIMSNFEVWRVSSLKYPFGLGRIEVLIGFSLSVSLLFVGLDLFSHIVEEILMSSLENDSDGSHSHEHSHGHSTEDPSHQLHPVFYEVFILGIIVITLFTSHTINDTTAGNKKEDSEEPVGKSQSKIAPNVKRLSSITLNEPTREGIINRLQLYMKLKFGLRPNLFHSSTTNLSILYAFYSLYYPFAQGVLRLQSGSSLLSAIGFSSKDEHADELKHEHDPENSYQHELLNSDALEATEWINEASTVIMAFIVSIVAWRLIWRLGNILLLTSPSVAFDKRNTNLTVSNKIDRIGNHSDVESLIVSNVRQLDVYKNSYTIEEVKIARVNTRVYVVIIRIHMPGASDDEESKFRFYTMRIIRGIMYKCVKGQLKKGKGNRLLGSDSDEAVTNNESIAEENRRSLIDLLNLSTSIEDVEGIDNSGDQFEITIDVSRL